MPQLKQRAASLLAESFAYVALISSKDRMLKWGSKADGITLGADWK